MAWLGIDLGTSSVKAVLVGDDGERLALGRAALALDVPEPLAAEQSAASWWIATVAAVRACLDGRGGDAVAGVGLTGQKHALLALDARGRPLAPARLWADGRAVEGCERLRRLVPDLARRSGAPALPGYLLPKWIDLCAREPRFERDTAHLLFAKDWLRYRLTGELATDPTEAVASQLYSLSARGWDGARCRSVGIDPAWLPAVVPSVSCSGTVSAAAARETGLAVGTPVVGGAGDNEAAALACGAVRPGALAVILGTSGTVIGTAPRRGRVGGLVWGRHVTRRGLTATGTMLSAGRALDWARATFLPAGTSAEDALRLAMAVEDDVPTFVPALVGERSPTPDPHARGAFLGLAPQHDGRHLVRAVVEGVSATLGQIVDLMRASHVPVEELRLTSGGAASAAWRQLILAAAAAPGRLVGAREEGARGAALLAARMDARDDALVAAADAWARLGPREEPDEALVARMREVGQRVARARDRLG